MVLSVPISPVGVAACRHDQTACRQLLCDRCCLRGSHSARSCRFPLCFTSPRPSGDTEALQYRPLQHRVKSLRLYATAMSDGGQRNEAQSSCRCVHGSIEPFLAVMGDASGLATCSNMLLYCAEHHATCAAQVTLNALRRHQQEGRASGTRVQVEASSVGTRPDRMLGRPRDQRERPRGSLESARRSRSSCGGSARAGGSLCWADDYKRGRRRRWQRLKLVW